MQCIKICVNHYFVVLHLNLRVTCKPSHIKYSSLGVYSMFGKKIFSKKPYPRRKTGHAHFSLSFSLSPQSPYSFIPLGTSCPARSLAPSNIATYLALPPGNLRGLLHEFPKSPSHFKKLHNSVGLAWGDETVPKASLSFCMSQRCQEVETYSLFVELISDYLAPWCLLQ